MSTLFILSHAPHTDPGQARTVKLAREGDGILLIEDGVYAAAPIDHPLSEALAAASERGVALYALQPDLRARGIGASMQAVDYAGFVDLIESYERSVH